MGLYIYLFMWLRFTFPRYRFDQLMRLGWQFLIPLSIVNVMGIGVAMVLHRQWGWNRWLALPADDGVDAGGRRSFLARLNEQDAQQAALRRAPPEEPVDRGF